MIEATTQHGGYAYISRRFSYSNRYECPAGCLDATGKVVGTVYYEMVSTQVSDEISSSALQQDTGGLPGRKNALNVNKMHLFAAIQCVQGRSTCWSHR